MLGDVTAPGQTLIVARGGRHGFGNSHFKSSTNRAPRRTTPGEPGETRQLRLQLKLLADVGLLGLPNAGKSTFIAAVSAARPKVADYPFTTLVPSLGVVKRGDDSLVMADVPGLIRGAAEGAGLGVQFLRHLARTRMLLHLVEALPADGSDPVANARLIEAELAAYSPALAERPVWLALSKVDVVPAERRRQLLDALRAAFPGRPVHAVSAVAGEGVDALVGELLAAVAEHRRRMSEDEAFAAAEADLEARIGEDVLKSALAKRPPRSGRGAESDNDDDGDVEVVYVRE